MAEIYMVDCPYCGQLQNITSQYRLDEEELEKMAIMQCNCSKARHDQLVEKKLETAHANIYALFNEDGPELMEQLDFVAKAVAAGKIAKVSMVTASGIKATMTGKAETIKIERVETKKTVLDE